MKKFLLLLIASFLSVWMMGQTTLISPTGDGGFETGGNPAANNWTAVNSSTDSWIVGTTPGVSAGTNCGFISSTPLTTQTWTYSQFSVIQHLFYNVTIPAGESKVTLTFKWKAYGEGSGTSDYDNMKVFWGTASSMGVPVANTAISATYQVSGPGATSGMYKLNSTSYNTETINLTGTPGTIYRLAFSWKSDVSTIANPPAAIDEVSLISAAPAPLVGGTSYPINGVQAPPTSFSNIANAVAYLASDGVMGTGQVLLELSTGYAGETGPVSINAIPSVSATLGVTFRPALGYTALTTIAGGASPNQHAIKLNACSYVTLDGRAGGVGTTRDWNIKCTGANGQMAVRLDNTSGSMTGDVVRNLIMEAEVSGSTGAIFQITGVTTNTISNIDINGNLIRSNPLAVTFRGYGITLAVASNVGNTGILCRNNDITQFSMRGINLTGGFPGIEISGNEIHHTASFAQSTATEFSGIYISTTASPGAKIYNNYLHDFQLTNGSTAYNGIYFFNGNTTGTRMQAFNNRAVMGVGLATGFPIYGIRDNSVAGALIDIYHNSVLINGTATAGAINSAAFLKGVSNFLNIMNNIFYNTRTNSGGTGVHWAISINNTTFTSIGNNDYFANGTGGILGTTTGLPAGNQTTLAGWKSVVTADAGSVSQNPNYLADLKINTAIPTQLESGGATGTGITTDFEGDTRLSPPDIGSDEFAGVALDLTPPTISYTALPGTCLTSDRILIATITDVSGVPTSGPLQPRIYYKKNAGAYFSSQGVLSSGTGTSGTWTFTIVVADMGGVVNPDVISYFVIAQDIAATPNISSNPATGLVATDVNTVTTPPTTPNTYLIQSTMAAGTYLVGTGQVTPNFATLTAAVAAYNNSCLGGAIVFELQDASYTTAPVGTGEIYPIIINANPDASATNTLTIRPKSGVVVAITSSSATALLKLYGTDYVVIDGLNTGGSSLTFNNTNASGVDLWISCTLTDGANYNVVKNCTFLGTAGTGTIAGVLAGSGTTLGNTAEAANSNNTVQYNIFKSTQNGIYINGYATAPYDQNWVVSNNTFGSTVAAEKHGFRGMLIGNASNFTVSNNTIIGVLSSTSSSSTMSGIQVGLAVAGGKLFSNIIGNISQVNTTGWGANGIYLAASTTASAIDVYNNVIYDVTGYGYNGVTQSDNGYGIMIQSGGGYNLYYNSVNMYTSQTAATGIPAAINISSAITTAGSIKLQNNIFNLPSTNTTGTRYAIYCGAASTVFTDINYNDYYSVGTLGYLGSAITTLPAWRTATGKDVNSINADPLYATPTNLLPQNTSPVIGVAQPLPGVVDFDILGNARGAATTMGAYELISTTIPTALTWTGAVNNSWHNPGNWNGTSTIPGTTTNATIPVVTNYPTLTANGNCNTLYMQSGTSILDNGYLTLTNATNGVTVDRTIGCNQYHSYSPSVSGATAGIFHLPGSTGLDVFLYGHNEVNNASAGDGYVEIVPINTPLVPMSGYAVYPDGVNATPPVSSWTFIQQGGLNTGSFGSSNNVTRTGTGTYAGFNYLGNPYPSYIDWDATSGWTKTNVNAATYVENSGNWSVYPYPGPPVNAGSNIIAPGQGFFIEVNNAFTSGTVTMNNNVRTHTTTPYLKSSPTDFVKLTATGFSKSDETVIRFEPNATPLFDGQFDGAKLAAGDDSYPQIYSIADRKLAYNALPETNMVQVGFHAGLNGEYQISLTDIADISNVWLEDTFNNEFTNLTTNSYSFVYMVGDAKDRFILHFAPLAVGELAADLFNIYSSHKDVYVNVPLNTTGDIVIYNLMGQEITRTRINGVLNKVTLTESAYYVVKVMSDESVVTKKVFVK